MTCEIEPEAAKIDSGNSDAERDTASLRSQAISLKRIADALERIAEAATETNEYGEGPAAAIGGNISRALR